MQLSYSMCDKVRHKMIVCDNKPYQLSQTSDPLMCPFVTRFCSVPNMSGPVFSLNS